MTRAPARRPESRKAPALGGILETALYVDDLDAARAFYADVMAFDAILADDRMAAFAARALASRGYTVLEADTGVAALEIMDSHEGTVDLVVSDVVMPEMDGPTLLKEVRKRNPKLKVIFVSGYAEDAFAKNLEGGEQFHFLPKPFNLKELAATVKEVMSS